MTKHRNIRIAATALALFAFGVPAAQAADGGQPYQFSQDGPAFDPGSAPVEHVEGEGANQVHVLGAQACSRRAISLVRADPQGRNVILRGLVSQRFYGKPVRISVSRGDGSKRIATGRASRRNGTFRIAVRTPRTRDGLALSRYRAHVGRRRSADVKIPQSLQTRRVSQNGRRITIKGRVKPSLLGKRNRVTITQLVCGSYTKVGSARPRRDGRYTVTFRARPNSSVALLRAETRVLLRPKGERYVRQYARAITLQLTDATG